MPLSYILNLRRRQLHFLLYGQLRELFRVGRSAGKIIVIIIVLSSGVGISEDKNIDHGVTETFAIMSTQVTYEIDHIPVLRDC